MKKISVISFLILSTLLSAFALPAQGQLTASQSCTLVETISIEITVRDPAGVIIPAEQVLQIGENSLVSSVAGAMVGAQTQVEDADADTAFENANANHAAAIADEWGTICLVNTVNNIINWIFFILLTVAFFLIVIAAFIWTTSAGDAAKQENARNIIIAAMVGIVIAILAQLIPAVVLGIVT